MSDLRTAAQQALDDLKDLHTNHNITYAGTISRLEAALAQEPRQKTGKPKNATTRLGVVCFEAYARSYVGTNRWDIAAEAVRAALAEHFCDTHCTWADHAAGCVNAEPVQEPVQEYASIPGTNVRVPIRSKENT